MPDLLSPDAYRDLVRRALAEDVGTGDVTTRATVPAGTTGRGRFVVKQACTVAGLVVAAEVFAQVDPRVVFEPRHTDGDACRPGTVLAEVAGPAAALLVAERTALNFLQYLSGIATETRAFVSAAGPKLTVLDTRKTTPTFRQLAKYAVRCGGGRNHRTGLYDGVLIKDNHIRLAGGIREAVDRVRREVTDLPVEVETRTLEEVDEAVAAGADVIMLDNFADVDVGVAVARIAGRAKIEVSGNLTLARVASLADAGVDRVSVGGLTHSAPAADISFDIDV